MCLKRIKPIFEKVKEAGIKLELKPSLYSLQKSLVSLGRK